MRIRTILVATLTLALGGSAMADGRLGEKTTTQWRNQYGWGGHQVQKDDQGKVVSDNIWSGRKDAQGKMTHFKEVRLTPNSRETQWTVNGRRQFVAKTVFLSSGSRAWTRKTKLNNALTRVTSSNDRPGDAYVYELAPGGWIPTAIADLAKIATKTGHTVMATFNGVNFPIPPGESAADAEARWRDAR